MIRDIEIKNFRGFRHFRLEGLTDLTILTGRNGCGKSSVLDALLIGAAPNCAEAVGLTVQRHPRSKDGARWLFYDPKIASEFALADEAGRILRRGLKFSETVDSNHAFIKQAHTALDSQPKSGPIRQVTATISKSLVGPGGQIASTGPMPFHLVAFDLNGNYVTEVLSEESGFTTQAKLIDSSIFEELSRAFTKAVQQGLRTKLQDLLRVVLPDLSSIQILTEDDGSSNIYLEGPQRAVPLSFSGDGIAALLQIAIEAMLVEPGGLVLIEEPEVFLHPRGISAVAGLLLELIREGRQVVVTTHSLELIDSLLGRSEDADTERMSLFNLRPQDGAPKVVAWPGKDIDFIRNQVGDDLR